VYRFSVPDYIELHDAQVERLSITPGRLEISFGDLDVSALTDVVDLELRLVFAESASRLACRAATIALTIESDGERFESFEEE